MCVAFVYKRMNISHSIKPSVLTYVFNRRAQDTHKCMLMPKHNTLQHINVCGELAVPQHCPKHWWISSSKGDAL